MSNGEIEFDADELEMLRQLFRNEARGALEQVTERLLATGSTRPSPEALTEMMRVTHTLKGAAGTVGLHAIVDLSHRLENALEVLCRGPAPWKAATADLMVEVIDAFRTYLDYMTEPGAEAAMDELRVTIDQMAQLGRLSEPQPRGPEEPPASAELPDPTAAAPLPELPEQVESPLAPWPNAGPVPEPKVWLRVEPARVDELMSSAGELLFDRTRIERRVQLLRTLARDLARTRQALHDAVAADSAAPPGSHATLTAVDGELAGQAALLSQTTAALLDEIEALRRTIGVLQRGLTRIRMEPAKSLMTHAARTLRALRRATGVTVELRTFGEDTEFDKAVADQLVDPITQLLRNAVAHGVEPAEERAARGRSSDRPCVFPVFAFPLLTETGGDPHFRPAGELE
jgi:chemotaxis protein histidine kinase CheA